jgi:bifunctional DNA-binding transcriptional regulator/antitoxin component of YhaV-PrlF toxin-antitoxin module
MNKSGVLIRKVFGSGQVTLPKSWREQAGSDVVEIRNIKGVLQITPVKKNQEKEKWVEIFDVKKVYQKSGKSVELKKFLAALKKANQK